MSCQRVAEESCEVVIQIPKPFRTRCRESWTACMSATRRIVLTVFYLGLLFVIFGLVWVLVFCQGAPGMSLEAMSVQAMRPYENSTVAPPESPWQVSSVFNVRLSTWNPNTVAGCFCTFRRVIVRVEYRGQVIVHQEVPLGFGLKPQRTAPASFQVQGNGFPLQNPDLGPFMETELRTSNVSFDFYFDARYLRNDRKAGWLSLGCHVMAKTPSNSSQAGDDGLLAQDCY